jgi:hypothetical protein
MKLYAIKNNAGDEFQLLTPFFKALLPAFEDKADEIRIEPVGAGLKLAYGHKSLSAPLPSSERNYAWVVFPRILILCEMSIALQGAEQSGRFRVRCDNRVLSIDVTSRRDKDGWYLIFRPAWSLAKPDHESSHEVSA